MKIIDNTSAVLREVGRLSSAGLEELESVLVGKAKDIVVVVSGDLQDSITAEVSKDTLTVGSPLPYAPKVEMDKPFLRPALEGTRAEIKKVFRI